MLPSLTNAQLLTNQKLKPALPSLAHTQHRQLKINGRVVKGSRGKGALKVCQATMSEPVLHLPDPSSNLWDGNGASSPTVLRFGDSKVLRMYYYGRPGQMLGRGIDAKVVPGVPFGWIGCAESVDGVSWTRVEGSIDPPGGKGAVFGPSEQAGTFDSTAVGLGDVLLRPDGSLWLYYFGFDIDKFLAAKELDKTPKPLGLTIGLAISTDGGLTFERQPGPILSPGAPGEWDERSVGWPKVLPPEKPGEKWMMSYHSNRVPLQWEAGVAFSDDGIKWEKYPEPVLGPGAEDSFDELGIGTRHVVKVNGQFWMIYEGVMMLPSQREYPFKQQIGVARSMDGIHWKRVPIQGKDSGGPVLELGEKGSWDDYAIGTPHVFIDENGAKLYYVGFGSKALKSQIGVATASLDDMTRWKR